MTSKRWKLRPEGSTWGDFGADDERGRLNLLTPATTLQAIAEVKVGRSFCLSLPLDYPGGKVLSAVRNPPQLRPVTLVNGEQARGYALRRDDKMATDVFNDDDAILALQYSTHWDSLAHVGQSFDGFRTHDDLTAMAGADRDFAGVQRLGVENMATASVQGRGVMIDLDAHFGRSGTLVGYRELAHVLRADKIVVEPGDFVCLHTGFGELLLEMGRRPDRKRLFETTAALDGSDEALKRWITETGLVALVADNYAVERLPASRLAEGCSAALPLHEHCLFRLGVYLGELWYLSELAAWLRQNGRIRFLLTAPPLRLPGAVASPVTPIATV
jgi:hypothetical protein